MGKGSTRGAPLHCTALHCTALYRLHCVCVCARRYKPAERGKWYSLLSTNQNAGAAAVPLLVAATTQVRE